MMLKINRIPTVTSTRYIRVPFGTSYELHEIKEHISFETTLYLKLGKWEKTWVFNKREST